jgi:hypothetical protein
VLETDPACAEPVKSPTGPTEMDCEKLTLLNARPPVA